MLSILDGFLGDDDLAINGEILDPGAIAISTGSGVTPDPLIGGTPVDGLEDWFFSEWFGYYSTALAPWLVHGEHGFIYRYPASTNESMFVYDDAMKTWPIRSDAADRFKHPLRHGAK